MIMWKFDLEFPYKRPFKCGFDPVSALVGAAEDAIGTVTGGLVGSGMDALGLDSTKNFAREQMSWQSQENLKNRQFQAAEAEKAREYNTQERIAVQNYNSAESQVRRLGQAGINAATAFSGSNGSIASQAASQGALPQGSASVSAPSVLGIGQSMFKGETIRNVSQAYKEAQEGTATKQKLGDTLKLLAAQVRNQEIRNDLDNLTLSIQKRTGNKRADAEIESILADGALKVAQKATELQKRNLTEQEFNNAAAQYTGLIYESIEKQFRAMLGRVNYKKAEIDLQYYKAMLEEQMKTMRSEQSRNYASAEESRSSARLQDEEKRFKKFDNDLREKWSYDYAETYVSELEKNKALSDAQAAEARRKIKAISEGSRSAKEVDLFLRWLSNTIGLSASVHN